jgi:hypothetical protein
MHQGRLAASQHMLGLDRRSHCDEVIRHRNNGEQQYEEKAQRNDRAPTYVRTTCGYGTYPPREQKNRH